MSNVFFLFLRRLRAPLIILVCVYSIAVLGMVLIPGVTENGEVWNMSFFHAFYFVSFMGTTIGFGEIPHPFTDTQRIWVLVCIYISVIAWLYAIGNLLRLLQDDVFKQAVSSHKFKRQIKNINYPFYIVCGYGETGRLITQGLSDLGMQTVILDNQKQNTYDLELLDLRIPPIVLNEDAVNPENLLSAGLNKSNCQGVIAVIHDDHNNLQVAVNCKLLNPDVPIISRTGSKDEADNMASFGTDHIINPFTLFAQRLNLLVNNTDLHQLHTWFINQQHSTHLSQRRPSKGRWIICGYGRLGQSIHKHLNQSGIELTIIEEQADKAPDGALIGRGTEAITLQQAGIHEADVIISGTYDDANNLSILITARSLNKSIYTIGRVNHDASSQLYHQTDCDYIFKNSKLVANEILTLISRPLVTNFIEHSKKLSEQDITLLLNHIKDLVSDELPITWRLIINEQSAPALFNQLNQGTPIQIKDITKNNHPHSSATIPLLLQRGSLNHIMPTQDMKIEVDDEILFCGKKSTTMTPQALTHNDELIDSLINLNPHYIPLLRWWHRKRKKQNNIQDPHVQHNSNS